MNVNERYITFSPKSARLPYPEDLELGQDITVTVGNYPMMFNVVKVEFFDNQDGHMNVNYILKSLLE
jgi:hypothetical protein